MVRDSGFILFGQQRFDTSIHWPKVATWPTTNNAESVSDLRRAVCPFCRHCARTFSDNCTWPSTTLHQAPTLFFLNWNAENVGNMIQVCQCTRPLTVMQFCSKTSAVTKQDAMQTGTLPWRWRRQAPPNPIHQSTRCHINTALRTSNLVPCDCKVPKPVPAEATAWCVLRLQVRRRSADMEDGSTAL